MSPSVLKLGQQSVCHIGEDCPVRSAPPGLLSMVVEYHQLLFSQVSLCSSISWQGSRGGLNFVPHSTVGVYVDLLVGELHMLSWPILPAPTARSLCSDVGAWDRVSAVYMCFPGT